MKKMQPKTCKTVRLVWGIVFSVYTAVVAALCLWQLLDIYLGGTAAGNTSPFTYEGMTERISSVIAIPFWIWIAGIVVGFVLWEVFPVKQKLVPYMDPRYVLNRLKKKMPAEVDDSLKDSFNYVKREEKILKILWIVALVCVAGGLLAYIIAYVSIPSHFPNKDKTGEMLNMAAHILPFAAAAYAVFCALVIYERNSAKRQLPHVKTLTKGVKAAAVLPQNILLAILNHKYFILGVRVAIACVGVAFVLLGVFYNDSIAEVFNKAIRICTECIGLG